MKTMQILNRDEPYSESPWAGDTFDYVREGVSAPASQETDGSDADPSDPLRPVPANVIDLPRFAPLIHRPTEFFAAIHEWEGVVTDVLDDYFNADLYDMALGTAEVTEVAQISFEDIDPQDRARVQRGAIFRWLIGRSRTRSGTSSRKWVIYFRRVPRSLDETSPFASLKLPMHLMLPLEAGDQGSGIDDVRGMDPAGSS